LRRVRFLGTPRRGSLLNMTGSQAVMGGGSNVMQYGLSHTLVRHKTPSINFFKKVNPSMHRMAHTLPGSQLSCIARLWTPPPTSPLCCTPRCVRRSPPESQPDSARPLARHPPWPPPATSDRLTHAACLGHPPQPPVANCCLCTASTRASAAHSPGMAGDKRGKKKVVKRYIFTFYIVQLLMLIN
jgi:hypothetical protein